MVQNKEEIVYIIYERDKNYSEKKFKYRCMKEKNILVSRLKFRDSCLNSVNVKGIMGGCDPHSQVGVLQE